MSTPPPPLFPNPDADALHSAFVGHNLRSVPTPAVVLDRAILERNCKSMRDACEAIGVGFRAHVKSHKTVEVARMQIGSSANETKIVVSTVAEFNHLCDWLIEEKGRGKTVNVLYGLPFPPSFAPSLASVARRIGPGSVSALIDHPSQLQAAHAFKEKAGFPLQIFVKVDSGYHRAGMVPESKDLERLMEGIATFESIGCAELIGFYSHGGHSYAEDSDSGALKILLEELTAVEKAASRAASRGAKRKTGESGSSSTGRKISLSVGSTPTVTAVQNFSIEPTQGWSPAMKTLVDKTSALLKSLQKEYLVELHAGVYPILDLQQLATQVGPSKISLNSLGQPRRNTAADVAITVLAEVCSIYEERRPPEALIAAGTLALGREPCKAYKGWGIVGEWGLRGPDSTEPSKKLSKGDGDSIVDDGRSGWQVGKISQEHGILTKDPNSQRTPARLQVGQKVRVWPNHACVTGAMFGWYLVVDSSLRGKEDEIVDVWIRCRGW